MLLLVFFSGCQRGSAIDESITGTISATNVTLSTGALEKLTVRATNHSNEDLRLDFSVKSFRHQTYWKSVSGATLMAHETRTFFLKPATDMFRPYIGDYVMVYATGRDTPRSYFVADGYVAGFTTRLVNSNFSNWRNSPRLPLMWTPSVPRPNESVSFGSIILDGRKGVQIKLSTSQPGKSHVVFLQQKVLLENSVFRAKFLPTRDCDTQTKQYRNQSGVQLTDDTGNSILYCVSSRIHQTHVSAPVAGQSVVVYPGQLGKWNDLNIDPPFEVVSQLKLHTDSYGYINLRLVVGSIPDKGAKDGSHGRYEANAAFSDIRSKW